EHGPGLEEILTRCGRALRHRSEGAVALGKLHPCNQGTSSATGRGTMPKFRYCAVEYRQVEGGPPVFLFGAPCHEVSGWAGIPRKEGKEGVQTVGFQRVKSGERLKKLKLFLGEQHNVIANPILCAVRSGSRITFDPIEAEQGGGERIGWLTIDEPDYESHS